MPTKVTTMVSMGPNETIYMERYDSLITKVLVDSVPSYRQDYYSLSKPLRDERLESVNALLERIVLSSEDSREHHESDENNVSIDLLGEESYPEPESDDHLNTPPRDQLSCNSVGMGQLSPDDFGHVRDDESDITELPSAKYRLRADKIRHELENDCRSYADRDVDVSVHEQDCSSVELGRDALVDRGRDSSMLLLSPVAWNSHDGRNRHGNKKRQATTSAKKGLGVQRSRRNSDEEIEHWESPDYDSRYDDMYTSNPVVDSPLADGCVGSNHEKERQSSLSFLLQSQSPIEKCGTYDSYAARGKERTIATRAADSPIRPRRTIDYGKDDGAFSPLRHDAALKPMRRSRSRPGGGKMTATDDTIESVNCTILPRRVRLQTRGKVQTSETAQPLVQLKDGVCFRMNPLKIHHPGTKRSRSKSDKRRRSHTTAALSSSDPLEVFSSRVAERLDYVVQWLQEKDSDFAYQWDKENSSPDLETAGQSCLGKAVALSLASEQIRGVTLKMLNQCGARSSVGNSVHNSGGTLLVLRDKDEMDHWERIFRERSSLSVMNHGSLSPAARKRLSMDRCAGFDVVLTTFDSIKAKEKTFALDNVGRARVETPAQVGRWHASRNSGGVVHCKQLCRLHGIIWRRVVFTDVLGRGSYTLKSQTARCLAGRALNGFVRFLFYAQSSGGVEETLKESAQQLRSVAKILHVSEESAADSIVGDAMIDLNDISIGVDSSSGDRCIADTSLNDSEITAPN